MTARALHFVLIKLATKRMDMKDEGPAICMVSCKIRLSHWTIVKRLSQRVSQEIRVYSVMGNISFLADDSFY